MYLFWRRTFDDKEPRFRHQKWRQVFDDQSKSTPLSLIVANDQFFSLPLGEHLEPFEVWLPKDKIWERYNTISHISILEGEAREVSVSHISLAVSAMLTSISANVQEVHGCSEQPGCGDQ